MSSKLLELNESPAGATLYDVNRRNKVNFYKISNGKLLIFNKGTGQYEPAINKSLIDLSELPKTTLRAYTFDVDGKDVVEEREMLKRLCSPVIQDVPEIIHNSCLPVIQEVAEVTVTDAIPSSLLCEDLIVKGIVPTPSFPTILEELFLKHSLEGLPIKPIQSQTNYTVCYDNGWKIYQIPSGVYLASPCSISKDVVLRVINDLMSLDININDVFGTI